MNGEGAAVARRKGLRGKRNAGHGVILVCKCKSRSKRSHRPVFSRVFDLRASTLRRNFKGAPMHTNLKALALALTCGTVITAAAPAWAVQYQITTLPTASAGQDVQAFGLNNVGQVAGTLVSTAGQQAFIYRAGAYTLLSGPAGALGGGAFAINDSGKVVGSYYDTQTVDPVTGVVTPGDTHGFIRTGNSYTRLDAPGATFTQARGLSPDGRYVTGYSTDASGQASAFAYDTTTKLFINLNRPNSVNTFAQGVNAASVVVGSDFLTQPGAPTQRVGYTYDLKTGQRNDYAFAGYTRTAFRGINDSGVIAGWLQKTNAAGVVVSVGFAGSPTAYDLIEIPGATDVFVQGINNAGVLSGYYTSGSNILGFLATPVPEPQQWAMLLAGLCTLLVLAQRTRGTNKV
jgi:uncharacterized membrane protein